MSARRIPSLVPVLGALLLFFLSLAPASAESDPALERAQALLKGGAPQLALDVLTRAAPSTGDMNRWLAFERLRLSILRALHDWPAIVLRAEAIPANVPDDTRRWFYFQAADAELNAHRAEGARRWLRKLIWQDNLEQADQARAQRLVIRSYLVDDNLDDAQIALTRYRQEHGRGEVWKALHAEILLRQNQPKTAFEILAGAQTYEARLLRLLASLRAGLYSPADTLVEAEKLAKRLRALPAQRYQALALAAEAATRAKDPLTRIVALEAALAAEADAREAGAPIDTRLFRIGADDLWQSYLALAEQEGNRARLIGGDDCAWSRLARQRRDKSPVQARALYALLAMRGATPAMRDYAHDNLAAELFDHSLGDVARALYTTSRRYPKLSDIPAVVRYRLADKALGDYDIVLAAKLVHDLKTPPNNEDPDGWWLRRARILIFAGEVREAATLLNNLLEKGAKLDTDFAERYLQALFDLQSIGQHAIALPLLEGLYNRVDSGKLRRELLYWQAESQAGLGHHRDSAELYLRSATYGGLPGEDPWGHTARFQAARELASAGHPRDARDVFRRLLASTSDPHRRSVIERHIQQLWLIESQRKQP